MTNTKLNTTVATYFERMGSPTPTTTLTLFTYDAVVVDDGQTYSGRPEILQWLDGPASDFTTTSTLLSTDDQGPTTAVVVLLEGDFPGGRVELTHRFTLGQDDLITELTIIVQPGDHSRSAARQTVVPRTRSRDRGED